jgi:hypothetical protein
VHFHLHFHFHVIVTLNVNTNANANIGDTAIGGMRFSPDVARRVSFFSV